MAVAFLGGAAKPSQKVRSPLLDDNVSENDRGAVDSPQACGEVRPLLGLGRLRPCGRRQDSDRLSALGDRDGLSLLHQGQHGTELMPQLTQRRGLHVAQGCIT